MTVIGRFFLVFSLMVLLAFGTFGMLNMGMQMDGTMSHCPFSPTASVCTMSPLAHINASQTFFTSMVTHGDALILFALMALAFFAISIFWKPHAPPLGLAFARAHHTQSTRLTYLQEAFSNGILNPKLF